MIIQTVQSVRLGWSSNFNESGWKCCTGLNSFINLFRDELNIKIIYSVDSDWLARFNARIITLPLSGGSSSQFITRLTDILLEVKESKES